ncbi:GntR family transcriptional regulator [Micromonospora sediminicola]|uniref:GntR family transcriptional regulator n=1 Tax=Micromonospora sediminicola TaxID=946078 RepID=A0A1A9BJD1_9ACTN|nr:GntR family transcriptional regulator [Micromonospora sediminicola]
MFGRVSETQNVETFRGRSVPAYQRIATAIRDKIVSGELAGGEQLPTELELAEQWGVARQTVRNGIAVLVSEGLVVAKRPLGHFVRKRENMLYRPQGESRDQPVSPEMDRFYQQITEEGRVPSQTIDVSLVQATPDIAQRLRVDPGTVVVARRRVRYINGEPININDSHFPLDIVKDSEVMLPADVARGTNQVLADLGYPQDRAIDEIYTRMPTPEQIHRLGLGPGTPVAVHYVTGYVADGTPVRCTVNVLPSDQHVIVFERKFERTWS